MAQSKGPYDVFLSFRGPDTRLGFVSHLYKDLDQRGIYTFKDDEKIKKGERISDVIIKAIEESRIAVIIFSQRFASSSWCLDEVATIMDRKAAKKIIVLPVFHNVDPRTVRKGRNENEDLFNEHEKKYGSGSEIVKKWKENLEAAGSLCGWEFNNWNVAEPQKESIMGSPKDTTRIQLESEESKVTVELREGTPIQLGNRKIKHEAQLVESIVREIWMQLKPTHLDDAVFPVGIDSRVEKLISKLNIKSQKEIFIIGLWSMGGMGKTTLARALYNSILKDFEGSAYIDDIRETSQGSEKMVPLQQNLLYQMLTIKETSLNSDAEGCRFIKDRLFRKRVLLILDGVDDICQVDSLAKEHNWFGEGSRIIITTTDKSLLNVIGACIHEVQCLNDDEARELFEKHAYRSEEKNITRDLVNSLTKEKRENLVKRALQYAQGLPLALVVLGGSFAASGEEDWEGKLDNFAKRSDQAIDKKLRISYDKLNEDNKDIFLHIACFFNGWRRTYVEGVLKNCGLPVSGVKDLIQRSLIMEENGTLKVHDLIELMGKNIVDRECRHDAAKRSRLWRREDVIDILSRDEGTDAVNAIVLALPNPETIDIRSEAVAKLKNLRFLIMINVRTNFRDPICLPRKLGWFEWPECSASSLKFTSPDNLSILAVRRGLFT